MREDQQFEIMRQTQAAVKVEDLVLEQIDALEQSVDKKIYSILGKPIEPWLAMQLLTEKATYGRLRKKFNPKQSHIEET